jgi:hypothetical protein
MDFRTPTDYRGQAEKCLELSGHADDQEGKLHWLCFAEAWLLLSEGMSRKTFQGALGTPRDSTFTDTPSPTRH